MPTGCPGIKKVATGIAGICPLRFFGQRAGRALHFYRAGGQNRARACPLNITNQGRLMKTEVYTATLDPFLLYSLELFSAIFDKIKASISVVRRIVQLSTPTSMSE